MTPDALKRLIKRLSDGKSIVNTLPSVTVLQGKSAILEIITEHPDNPKQAPVVAGTDDEPPAPDSNSYSNLLEAMQMQHPIYDPAYRFAGIRIFCQTKPDGKNINLTCKADYRHFPNSPGPLEFVEPPASKPWKNLSESRAAKQDLQMRPGESTCLEFGEITQGRYATLLVTVVPLDRTFREIAGFSTQEPIPKIPETPPPTASRIDGFFVDAVTNQESLPPPGATATIYSAEQAELRKKSLKGKVTEIPAVNLPGNKSWQKISNDLPDLRVIVRKWGTEKFAAELLIAIRRDHVWSTSLSLTDYKDHFVAFELPASVGGKSRLVFLRVNPTFRATGK